MNDTEAGALATTIRRLIGVRILERDYSRLRVEVNRRARELNIDDHRYFGIIEAGGTAGQRELDFLVPAVCNPETYFFRDDGQMELLRKTIIPRLYESGKGRLRIWSAGCSTGEEVWSLGILAAAALPLGGDARVIGTDINNRSLQHGRRGVYGQRSFRRLDNARMQKHFTPHPEGHKVIPPPVEIDFRQGNLLSDLAPGQFDLVICRNVFIYMDTETVSTIARKLAQAVRPGGFLMTGHTELHGVKLHGMETRVFPESVVLYRLAPGEAPQAHAMPAPVKGDARHKPITRKRAPLRRPAPAPTVRPEVDPMEDLLALRGQAPEEAISKARRLYHLEGLLPAGIFAARTAADRGDLSAARPSMRMISNPL